MKQMNMRLNPELVKLFDRIHKDFGLGKSQAIKLGLKLVQLKLRGKVYEDEDYYEIGSSHDDESDDVETTE